MDASLPREVRIVVDDDQPDPHPALELLARLELVDDLARGDVAATQPDERADPRALDPSDDRAQRAAQRNEVGSADDERLDQPAPGEPHKDGERQDRCYEVRD